MSFRVAVKSVVFFFMFCIMAVGVSFMQPEVMAATGSWGDNVQEVTPNSEGVYEISNGAQLAWIAQQTNLSVADGGLDFLGKTVKLTSNIDLADHYWVPIGKEWSSSVRITFFNGTFDGAGKSITGLTINSTEDYQGLFGYVRYATIKNFTVSGTVTSTGNYIAGAVGYSENSTISNIITDVNVTGGNNTGGIAGKVASSILFNSENRGDITGNEYVGGIIGVISTPTIDGVVASIVVGVFNSGNISGVNGIGGIAGTIYNSKLAAAYNHGSVSGDVRTGGISGSAQSPQCYGIYNTGIVTTAPGDLAFLTGALFGQVSSLSHSNSIISGGYYLSDNAFGNISSSASRTNISSFNAQQELDTAATINGSSYTSLVEALNAQTGDYNQGDPTVKAPRWEVIDGGYPSFNAEDLSPNSYWKNNATEVVPSGDIYSISNASQLAWIALETAGGATFEGKQIVLTDNINLEAHLWSPISPDYERGFMGTFDGNNHSITGLKIVSTVDVQGLFGVVGQHGIIDSVTAEGSCNGVNNVGGIVGDNSGLITNCTGLVEVSGETGVGGIVGNNSGTITNSYTSGSVSGEDLVGGVAGHSSKSLMNVYSVATVNHTGSSSADSVGQVVGALSGLQAENNYILYLTSHEGPNAVGLNSISDDIVFGYDNSDLLLTGLSRYIDPTGRAADWTVKSGGTPYLSFEDNGITGRMDLQGDAAATITLKQGENTVYKTITRSTDFILGDVASGSYTLTISTDGALDTVIHNLEHSGGALDLKTHANSDIKLIKLFFGDLNINGVIDGADIAIVASSENYNKQSSAADNALADVNRDGIINFIDLATLRNSALLGKTYIEINY